MLVDLSLGFLFRSIDLYICLCASTILSWWLWLCSRVWSQAGWFLQFHSSFSILLWLFEVCCFFLKCLIVFTICEWNQMYLLFFKIVYSRFKFLINIRLLDVLLSVFVSCVFRDIFLHLNVEIIGINIYNVIIYFTL